MTSPDQEEPLFTFAIVTDTHIRPPDGDDSSPFAVNDLANDRARYAIAAIARHGPEFTIHLGDMVHPLPHLPTYGPAAEEALSIFEPLREEMRFVPGNHDIGDKPMAGSPAGAVDEASTEIYRKYFGPGTFSFDHKGLHVVVMNSSLVNSGTEMEVQQSKWLEADLAAHRDERVFLFSHYPPFINTPDEQLHYDNYEEPGRSWLLELVQRCNVEAVFSGHVHQFFYNRLSDTKLYCLPPTSFTRQDYSELYEIGPAPEFGRNDSGKFSYALVDFFPSGHRLRVIPTEGRTLGVDETLEVPDPVAANPEREPLTVHLRHAWARATDMPYNGPMEEFARKRARDDYVLLRLWQMGIARVRTPLSDLTDGEYGRRVRDYHASGVRFTFFCPGVPSAPAWEACKADAGMIDVVEFVSNQADLSDLADDLAGFDGSGGPPVHIGKFHSSAHEPKQGSKFAHSVSFGFKWEDRDTLLAALWQADRNRVVSGAAFQVNMEDDLMTRLNEMNDWAKNAVLSAVAVIRLADVNPAEPNFDDDAILGRVRDATALTAPLDHVTLQLDTYADIDRGYHPRHGLLDGRSNFRPAGRFLALR
ncbi:MAG: metallophosphoesterase [Hyphomicrobiaceae bacterium]|nr:metallophosphoesterase [Hyphomicrobiaceae bacterium]